MRRAWPWIKRALTFGFFALVAVLLVRYGRRVDWADVGHTLRTLPAGVLAAAIGLAVLSHLLYSCFDLIGRRYTGHGLPVPKAMLVNFISYAFNLNMGSLVGGVAFRYRMYSRFGLDPGTITRVLTLSMLTNWLGYLVIAGALFLLAPLPLPPDWRLDSEGLRLLGALLLLVATVYLTACAFSPRRSWTVRGHELILPRIRMAAVQLALSCSNWLVIAATVHVLLQARVAYTTVLGVMLVAAVAGVITHVPAGLGVLEAVFVALLSHRVPESQLIGALLGYRAIYYIGPLLLAAVLYVLLEARAKSAKSAKKQVTAA